MKEMHAKENVNIENQINELSKTLQKYNDKMRDIIISFLDENNELLIKLADFKIIEEPETSFLFRIEKFKELHEMNEHINNELKKYQQNMLVKQAEAIEQLEKLAK